MVSVDQAVIAKITKAGITFEVLVDPVKALEFKKGKPYSVENLLAANIIFKDSKKGERASNEELKKAFESIDQFAIAATIIKDGTIQLTTDQRRKMVEEKRLEIATLISRQGVDPKTHIPHPQLRILNAMHEAHVDIDPFKPATEQMGEIVEEIRAIIPISFERISVAIRVPNDVAGKASSYIRSAFELQREEWKPEAWFAEVSIPAGMQSVLYEKLNSIASGRVEVKVIKRETI